ncbi:MAG TPA: pyruvate, water dikinase regulatory protein [Nitrospirota bacterium]|nr:pyruvate, water dikinase regulatory protein [Nitrospirota bacterium]
MEGSDFRKRHPRKKVIYLVGDSTGETISKLARASLAQFSREQVEVKTFFMITDKHHLAQVIKQAAEDEALIAFTIIQPLLRDFLIREAERQGMKAIDVIGDFILQLSTFLEEKPAEIPGRQYVLDEDYYRRIEAINFAVKHDDGKTPQGLKLADLVLVGLSRTSKTPLSAYLANQGWKVANVPIHPDMDPPDELLKQVDPKRVFGLLIDVEHLVKLRAARLQQLGLEPYAKYADPVTVCDEIEWCRTFYEQHPRWRVLDISSRAIEETAASILRAYQTGKKPT